MSLSEKDLWLIAAEIIPGFHTRGELAWLYDAFSPSKTHVEVGSFCGRSLFASAGGMEGAHVISIEPGMEYPTPRYKVLTQAWRTTVLRATLEMLRRTKPDSRFTLIERYSPGALEGFKAGELDSVYIDGNHQYESCKADIAAALSKIHPGGIIAGHDYITTFPGVMRAVNELIPWESIRFAKPWPIWFYRLPEVEK